MADHHTPYTTSSSHHRTPRTTEAKATTDHAVIKHWVESRGGRPARVRMLASGGERVGGILRIDFAGNGRNLEPITWESFFMVFDYRRFSFIYQDYIGGAPSRFYAIVSRVPSKDHPDPVREALNAANANLAGEEGALETAQREMEEGELTPDKSERTGI